MPSIASAASHLEALLLGAGGLPGMLDLPADADDEAMMELAIALSLQEQASAQGLSLQGLPLPGLQSQGLAVEASVSLDNASGMGFYVCSSNNVLEKIAQSFPFGKISQPLV